MILVTSDNIPGRKIRKVLGMVKGNTIRARHLGHDFLVTHRKKGPLFNHLLHGRFRMHGKGTHPDVVRPDGIEKSGRLKGVFLAQGLSAYPGHDVFRKGNARLHNTYAPGQYVFRCGPLPYHFEHFGGPAFHSRVDSRQAGPLERFIGLNTFFLHAFGAGIGGYPCDIGEFYFEIFNYFLHLRGGSNEGISVP